MDYIFFRIYLYYKSKENIPIYRGILFVFVIEFCTILLVGVTVNLFSGNIISESYIAEIQFWMLYGSILALLFFFNVFRYGRKGHVEKIVQRYEGNILNTKVKTWQVFVIPILIVALTILLVLIEKSLY